MIRPISKLSDLPLETLLEYRRKGWSDEEIVENINDAVDFLNSQLWRGLDDVDIPIDALFREA